MGSNERLSLSLDARTTGTAEILQLAAAINRVNEIASKSIPDRAAPKTGLENFPAQIQSLVTNPLGTAQSTITSFMSSLGGIGAIAAGAVGGLTAMAFASESATRSLADLGVSIRDTSLKTGLSVTEVGRFGFAARSVGSDVGVFESGMRKLSQALGDSGPEGDKARKGLADLGVVTRELNGDLKPTSSIFEQVAAGLSKMGSSAERNAEVVKIFGKSGIELIPVLTTLNERLARAKEIGIGLTESDVARYEKLKTKITEVDALWSGIERRVKEGLAGQVFIDIKQTGGRLILDFLGGNAPKGQENTAHSSGAGIPRPFSTGPSKQDVWSNGAFAYLEGGPRQAQMGTRLGDIGSFGISQQPEKLGSLLSYDNDLASVAAGNARVDRVQGSDPAKVAARAREAANGAYNDLISAKGSGDPNVKEKEEIYKHLEAVAKGAEEVQKMTAKAEAAHLAILEKMSKLTQEGTGFYHFGTGALESVVSHDDIGKFNKPNRGATLRRAGEYNPLSDENFLGADFAYRDTTPPSLYGGTSRSLRTRDDMGFNVTGGSLPAGIQNFGSEQTFVSPSDERNKPNEANNKARDESYAKGLEDRQSRADTLHLDALHNAFDIQSRIIELNSGPNGEYETAMKLSQLRLDSANEEYKTTQNTLKLDQDRLDVAKQQTLALADLQAKRKSQFGNLAGGFFDAATSGGPALGNFFKSQALGVGKQLFTNAATETVYPAIDSFLHPGSADTTKSTGSLLDRITKGTIFAKDPATSGAAMLNTAGTSLQDAALDLTKAAAALAGAGGPGGGAYNGTGLSMGNNIGQYGIPGLGTYGSDTNGLTGIPGLSDGYSPAASDISVTTTPYGTNQGSSTFKSMLGGLKHTGDIPGIFTGVSSGPNGAESLSTSERAGAAIGTAGLVIGGAEAAYSGFKRGGPGGITQGIGAIAGTAAALDPEPISKAVLAGVSLVSGIIGSALGDPKQLRSEAISKTLGNAKFEQPTAINLSQDASGGFSDYNARGGVRSSSISPYPAISDPSQYYHAGGFIPIPGQNSQYGQGNVTHNYNTFQGDIMDPEKYFSKHGDVIGNVVADQFNSNQQLASVAAQRVLVG